ncbi:MAG: hypothetical protein QOE83_160 [Actinomycetota bacterium]|nr:hypothetical protein [Actinomycetota bacterium]
MTTELSEYTAQEQAVSELFHLELPSALAKAKSISPYAEAEVHFATQRFRTAIKRTIDANEADPESPLVRMMVAFCLGQPDIPERSPETRLRSIVHEWPSLRRPKLYLAMILSTIPIQRGAALDLYREHLRQEPGDLQALLGVSATLLMLGDREQAAAAAMELWEAAPTWRWACAALRLLLKLAATDFQPQPGDDSARGKAWR